MDHDREEWIAKRAYVLWEQSGRPHGFEHEHWSQAAAKWDSGKPRDQVKPSWDDEEY